VLWLSDVWAGYQVGAPVLQGAGLSVEDGEVVAILGRNGVGKTTLLRTIMGIVPAERGRIDLDGKDLARMPVHARARLGLGYAPQGRELFPALSVLDNLREPGDPGRTSTRAWGRRSGSSPCSGSG
jgi:urea transport system ATP-binding protein